MTIYYLGKFRSTQLSTRALALHLEFCTRSRGSKVSLGAGPQLGFATLLKVLCKFGMYEFFKKYYSESDTTAWPELLKGLESFRLRRLPHTAVEFACFESIVEEYKRNPPVPIDKCSKPMQLGLSFSCGYVIGALFAVVDHHLDIFVSYPSHSKASTPVGDIKFFTRGLPLRMVMMATLTGAQFAIYGAFKDFVGLPSTFGATLAPAK
ncbi:Mitochondrial carrier domain containing protein [Trema orientale]|uniref:Mitochondrial carrier domain containing protein n=1 Tax=Trema orientale TaxID=63057 RepID=A0A2P5FD04_TREOI|nr:Mitochondrial carrier domain containing protein [Trema orientale]